MPTLRTPRMAVNAMFFLNGALFGIWASRIPAFVDRFSLGPDALGLLLLCLAGGAIVSFPIAGRLCDRLGAARVTEALALLYALGLAALALSPSLPVLALALLAFGAGHGAMDVTMNAWGAEVERHLARPVMPVFHAMWSLGAGLGAASGYVAVGAGIGVAAHFILFGALVTALCCAIALRTWTSQRAEAAPGSVFALPRGPLVAVGLVAAGSSLGEGAMADWSAVYLRDVTTATEAQAALGYSLYSVTMVAMRLSGAAAIGRLGAVRATRISGALAMAGIVLATLAPSFGTVLSGFVLIGMGYAVLMPLAFSRAAAEPGTGPGRAIASVATLGYGGMLLGPPLIGLLADLTSLRGAFALLALLAAMVVALAGVMGPPRPRPAAA